MLWIRIGFINADPDPAFYLNANPDPDPWSQTNADTDPGQTLALFVREKYTSVPR
jgi:hypothetical protein